MFFQFGQAFCLFGCQRLPLHIMSIVFEGGVWACPSRGGRWEGGKAPGGGAVPADRPAGTAAGDPGVRRRAAHTAPGARAGQGVRVDRPHDRRDGQGGEGIGEIAGFGSMLGECLGHGGGIRLRDPDCAVGPHGDGGGNEPPL